MRTTALERDIQRACSDWLSDVLPETIVFRRNVGALKKGNHFIRFAEKGASDLWGLTKGVHFEVEVKRPGNTLTKEQTLWLVQIAEYGGIALWTDSLRDLVLKMKVEYEGRGWTWNENWEVW